MKQANTVPSIGPYTLVINVRGGASYSDILNHLSFIYIHKISILEVFIVGIVWSTTMQEKMWCTP